ICFLFIFFFQAEDGIRDRNVTGVQTCALPICPFQTFRKIIFPLAAPGVFTTGILAFIAAWNEYLFALTINSEDKWGQFLWGFLRSEERRVGKECRSKVGKTS